MARIPPLEHATATREQLATLDWIERQHGQATNMKRTLARSRVALDALLTWYPLRGAVLAFLGERGVRHFCHAISTGNACVLCSTYFRRELIEAGEDPAGSVTEDPLAAVVAYGAALATGPDAIPAALWARLATAFTPTQLVELTAFGTLMIATNVFNNALGVDLDPGLEDYAAPAAPAARKAALHG